MIRHLSFFCFAFLLSSSVVNAQETPVRQEAPVSEKPRFRDRIYFGGNLGLQFGTTTIVDVSPQVGYRVTEKFIPGIGITYIYFRFKDPYSKQTYSTNIYGGSVFAKYFVFQNFFAHAEYQQINREVYDRYAGGLKRIWTPSLFLGGGYNQMLGERAFVQLMILFEVLQDPNSLYYNNNPLVRINFGF